MMNQSKNGKAGIWKVATFLPLLALLLMFCGRKSSNELPNFDRCEITNVSMCQRSKFIIELSVDKIVGSSDTAYFSKPKNLVYLIVTSKNMTELADGEYRFTSFPRYQLDSMTFTGIAYINKTENKISSGTLEINKSGDKVSISYQLYGKPAFSKEAITGSYVGAYSFEDRSLKTDDEEKYSLGELSNVSDSNQCLSIEANNEGNFINKQNCSLYGIVKKYYALKRINAENPITVNISNSSVNRIREIHEILALPNPIPYTNNTESSFQVVPPS